MLAMMIKTFSQMARLANQPSLARVRIWPKIMPGEEAQSQQAERRGGWIRKRANTHQKRPRQRSRRCSTSTRCAPR
jgi:hypothetical protein